MSFRIFHSFWKVFRFLPGRPGWWWYNDPWHWSPGICCPRPRWIFLYHMPRSSFGWAPGVPRLRSSWHTNLHRCSKYALRLSHFFIIRFTFKTYVPSNLKSHAACSWQSWGRSRRDSLDASTAGVPWGLCLLELKNFHLIGISDHCIWEKCLSLWFCHYQNCTRHRPTRRNIAKGTTDPRVEFWLPK